MALPRRAAHAQQARAARIANATAALLPAPACRLRHAICCSLPRRALWLLRAYAAHTHTRCCYLPFSIAVLWFACRRDSTPHTSAIPPRAMPLPHRRAPRSFSPRNITQHDDAFARFAHLCCASSVRTSACANHRVHRRRAPSRGSYIRLGRLDTTCAPYLPACAPSTAATTYRD